MPQHSPLFTGSSRIYEKLVILNIIPGRDGLVWKLQFP